jgi:tetratricopeptide (TPR) repeat protein
LRQYVEVTDANLSREVQQLDELFFAMQKRLPPDGKLSASDHELLATWRRFDETFLVQNEDNEAAAYERALAHRRCGKQLAVLGDLATSIRHYRQAIALLGSMSRQLPDAQQVLVDRVDTLARLGWVYRLAGRHEDADSAYQAAAALLPDRRSSAYRAFDPEHGFDPRMMNIYINDNYAEWALQRGNRSQALTYRERIIDDFRRLTVEFPQHKGYRARLAAAEARWGTVKQQPIAPQQVTSPTNTDP